MVCRKKLCNILFCVIIIRKISIEWKVEILSHYYWEIKSSLEIH
jgi:hypothetical protein